MNHRWLIAFFCFFLLAENRSAILPTPSNCTNSFGGSNKNQKLQTSSLNKPQGSSTNSYNSYQQQIIKKQQKKFHQSQKKKFESGCSLNFNNKKQIQLILKQWNDKLLRAQNSSDVDHTKRLKNRITALKKTIDSNYATENYSTLDFSKIAFTDGDIDALPCLYGTALDELLNQELCDARIDANNLQKQYPRNLQAQLLVPLIHEYAAQAKQESDITTAFDLSDVAHIVVTILERGVKEIIRDVNTVANGIERGICATANGIKQGICTFATPEHFKQMVIAPVHLLSLAGRGFTAYAEFEDAAEQADAQKMHRLCANLETKSKKTYTKFKAHLGALHEFIKNSPRDELLKSGAAVGTTLLLDFVFLNAAGTAASATSRAVIAEVATVFRNGKAADCALEVAGVSKLVVDKGERAVFTALRELEKHPEVVAKLEIPISEILVKEIDFVHPSMFFYPKGLKPTELHNVRRKPAVIHGRKYSGHAIERMQERGIMPCLVEHTIEKGVRKLNREPGRYSHYDSINNISVVTEIIDGKVVTAKFGRFKKD